MSVPWTAVRPPAGHGTGRSNDVQSSLDRGRLHSTRRLSADGAAGSRAGDGDE